MPKKPSYYGNLFKFEGTVIEIHSVNEVTLRIDLGFNVQTLQKAVLIGVGQPLVDVDRVRTWIRQTVHQRKCYLETVRIWQGKSVHTGVMVFYVDKGSDDQLVCLNSKMIELGLVEGVK